VFTTAADSQTSVTISVLQGEREMSADNKSIGRFDLVGIPAAPRGIPQIEVTFDIDANGILHVSAKDQGTGKEQSIRITPTSGLSDEEIDQMVKDAEINAEADKKKKELVEVKNQADTLIYSTEKSLAEHGDKVDEGTKKAIEESLQELKDANAGDNADAIKAAIDKLTQSAHKLAEEIYKDAQAKNAQDAEAGAEGAADAGAEKPADDVVDAEFEEVNDDKK
jgi:molecular chaperone DnaK